MALKKIDFVNGQAPALNAENLNQLQTNVEEAIGESGSGLMTGAVVGYEGDTVPEGFEEVFLDDSEDIVSDNVLFSNEEGSSEEITLTDTSANYSKFKIVYKDINDVYSCIDIDNPNGKSINLKIIRNGAVALVIYNAIITISENTITWDSNKRYSPSDGTYVDEADILITKVIGYTD